MREELTCGSKRLPCPLLGKDGYLGLQEVSHLQPMHGVISLPVSSLQMSAVDASKQEQVDQDGLSTAQCQLWTAGCAEQGKCFSFASYKTSQLNVKERQLLGRLHSLLEKQFWTCQCKQELHCCCICSRLYIQAPEAFPRHSPHVVSVAFFAVYMPQGPL